VHKTHQEGYFHLKKYHFYLLFQIFYAGGFSKGIKKLALCTKKPRTSQIAEPLLSQTLRTKVVDPFDNAYTGSFDLSSTFGLYFIQATAFDFTVDNSWTSWEPISVRIGFKFHQ
jgi:hypothetical protein